MTEDRINQLEETIAHQDKQIQDLSEVVARQDRDIILLKKSLLTMQDKVQDIEDASRSGNGKGLSVSEQAALNKPPHY